MTATDPVRARRATIEVPLHEKDALTYLEVEALGYCSERYLRQAVAAGRVARSVLRLGRGVRFLREVLIEELRTPPAGT